MYSMFILAIRFCSAEMAILVGKWPMADCYFRLCYNRLNVSRSKAHGFWTVKHQLVSLYSLQHFALRCIYQSNPPHTWYNHYLYLTPIDSPYDKDMVYVTKKTEEVIAVERRTALLLCVNIVCSNYT